MSQPYRESVSLRLRVLLLVFPKAFRQRHGRDLLELYRDFEDAGRRNSPTGIAWDLLRNGFGARLESLRPPAAAIPRAP